VVTVVVKYITEVVAVVGEGSYGGGAEEGGEGTEGGPGWGEDFTGGGGGGRGTFQMW
jgi:hypothetical protein